MFINNVKIMVTVPKEFIEIVRNAIFELGVGEIGNYTNCSICTFCMGSFKPKSNANPFLGKINKVEFVEELRLEINCGINKVQDVIKVINDIHPYEQPVIDIIPLLDKYYFN